MTTRAAESLRQRPLFGPVAVFSVAAGVLVTLALRDPAVGDRYPTCPFLDLTGCFCPGCGSMRGLHDLATGDLGGVVGHNVLLPIGVLLLAWAWLSWTGRRTGWWRLRPLPSSASVCYAALAVVVAFGVARNVAAEPFVALAP